MAEVQTIKTTDVVFREDLYPRFKPNQEVIQKYSDSTEFLPPIMVSQTNILIDGFHRWKAFQIAGVEDIPCIVHSVASERELELMAYEKNSQHGFQLSSDEKRRFAQKNYGVVSDQEMARLLSVSAKTISRWTSSQAETAKEERNAKIISMYLRAENTQEAVAEAVGELQRTVSNVIESSKNRQVSEFAKTFEPLVYATWTLQKQDNTVKHFGAFPELFMQNLLHRHTEPLDIVFDPFAGGGTTVDVCQQMFRRYYASDRKVKPGRESDIHKHDVKDGLPEGLPLPALAFLDPPYWKQAAGQYSTDTEDLGNMSIDGFNSTMETLFSALDKRKVKKIAVVISPTQYPNDLRFHDHIFDFAAMLPKYQVAMRYVLPYSTEQYNGTQVKKAKERNVALSTTRDLVVWERVK